MPLALPVSHGRGFNLAGRLARAHCRAAAYARVAELADAYGSGPYGETRGGSSPLASSYFPLRCALADKLFGIAGKRV
jgi:hypothetical protein